MAEGKESSGWNVQGGPFPTSVLYLNLFLNHVRSPCVPQLRRGLWILMRPDLGCRALPGFRLKGSLMSSSYPVTVRLAVDVCPLLPFDA